jgi:hypothetical protein
MGVAPLIADVLRKHQVPVTFFGANEKTKEGDGSLGQHWAGWWKERAAEGHDLQVTRLIMRIGGPTWKRTNSEFDRVQASKKTKT